MNHLSPYLILFLCICGISGLNSPFKGITEQYAISNMPLSNAIAPNKGSLTLELVDNAFVINMDLEDYMGKQSKVVEKKTIPVLISLYNSETIFASTCSLFKPFTCLAGECTEDKKALVSDVDEPYYKGTGHKAKVTGILDYSYWKLNPNFDIFMLDTCKFNTSASITTKNAYGIVGLGVKGNARNNFDSSVKSFSLTVEPSMQKAKIQFNPDIPKEKIIAIQMASDENWHITSNADTIQVGKKGNSKLSIQGKIIFDANTEDIALPPKIYYFILKALKANEVVCTNATVRAHCEYSGKIKDLPMIDILYEKEPIHIYPRLYVVDGGKNHDKQVESFTLNIRLSSGKSGLENYVTSKFGNYIILGRSFLKAYLVYFNFAEPNKYHVTLYGNNPGKDSSSSKVLILGFAIFAGVLAFLYCSYWVYFKIKTRKLKKEMDADSLHLQAALAHDPDEDRWRR